MARSTFYYHLKALGRADRYEVEKKRICEIFHESKGRYGYRRVTMQLHNEGIAINHKTVERLMKEQGLKCLMRKKRYRSYKGTIGKIAHNVLNRDFKADRPYQKLVTDVSRIAIGDKKSFLSPVPDLFNGEVLDEVFTITDKLPEDRGTILHSDQGWQYRHKSYQDALQKHGIKQSMSRKGNCLDNSVMENFFGLMKSELLYANNYKSMEHFKKDLKDYIEWYNNKRIKMKLKGMSPVQYRAQYLRE